MLQGQVLVQVAHGVVPIRHSDGRQDVGEGLVDHLVDVRQVPRRQKKNSQWQSSKTGQVEKAVKERGTYFFPVLICSGFNCSFLKCAKKRSTGAAS